MSHRRPREPQPRPPQPRRTLSLTRARLAIRIARIDACDGDQDSEVGDPGAGEPAPEGWKEEEEGGDAAEEEDLVAREAHGPHGRIKDHRAESGHARPEQEAWWDAWKGSRARKRRRVCEEEGIAVDCCVPR